MEKNVAIQDVFSKNGSTSVFISLEVRDKFEVALGNIRSGRNTTIELDQFFDGFDVYQDLLKKKRSLEEIITKEPSDEQYAQEIRQQLFKLHAEEKGLRINILEVALLLERAGDGGLLNTARDTFRTGQLAGIEHLLPEDLLSEKLDEYLKNEQRFADVSDRLVENSFEFFIKAHFCGMNFTNTDRLPKTIYFYEKGMISAEASANGEHLATSLGDFALFLQQHHQFEKAEKTWMRAVTLHEQLAVDDPQTHMSGRMRVLNNLAVIYGTLHQTNKQEWCLKAAITSYYEIPIVQEKDLLAMGNSYNSLAGFYKEKHDFEQAEKYYKEAIYIYETFYRVRPGEYDGYVAMAYSNLGLFYADRNNTKEALAYYLRSIEIREILAVADTDETKEGLASTKESLGNFYSDIGQFEDAEACLASAMEIWQVLSDKNPSAYLGEYAGALYNYGFVFIQTEQYERAEKYVLQSIAILEKLIREQPLVYTMQMVLVKKGLGSIRKSQGLLDNALEIYKEALYLIQEYDGPSGLDDLDTLANLTMSLAEVMKALNELDNSGNLYEEAISAYRELAETDPQSHFPHVIANLGFLADVRVLQGRPDEAVSLYEEGLKLCGTCDEWDGDILDEKAQLLLNFGQLMIKLDKYAIAARVLSEALVASRELVMQNRSFSLTRMSMVLHFISAVHLQLDEPETAMVFMRELINICRKNRTGDMGSFLIPAQFKNQDNIITLYFKSEDWAALYEFLSEILVDFDDIPLTEDISVDTLLQSKGTYLFAFAICQMGLGQTEAARDTFLATLSIQRELAYEHSDEYVPELVKTLVRLGIYHVDTQPDFKLAYAYVGEAFEIAIPQLNTEVIREYLLAAIEVLEAWSIDPKDFLISEFGSEGRRAISYLF